MAEYDRMSRTENPNYKPATWVAPTKDVQAEEGGGGAGSVAAPMDMGNGPWGAPSFRGGGGWMPSRQAAPWSNTGYGGFMYKPNQNITGVDEVQNAINATIGNVPSNPNPSPEQSPDQPAPMPMPEPQAQVGSGTPWMMYNGIGSPSWTNNSGINMNWTPPKDYGGIQYMPANDWRAQGQADQAAQLQNSVLQQMNGIQTYNQDQARTQLETKLPSFQQPIPTGANSFTSGTTVNSAPPVTYGTDSFTGAGGTQTQAPATPASTNVTPGFAYLPFQQQQPVKKIIAPYKPKTWGGYGGGGGGRGYSGGKWEDFLGNMNWKI